MSPQPISPRELGAHLIGQGIRITWEGAANGRIAILQGALAGINHHGQGTSLSVDIGVTIVQLSPVDLNPASIEVV